MRIVMVFNFLFFFFQKLADGSEEETVKKHFQEDTTADISSK